MRYATYMIYLFVSLNSFSFDVLLFRSFVGSGGVGCALCRHDLLRKIGQRTPAVEHEDLTYTCLWTIHDSHAYVQTS